MTYLIEVPAEAKFEKWYLNAIQTLHDKMGHGDGGIAALMIVMPLFERYLTPKIPADKKQDEQAEIRNSLIRAEFGFADDIQAAMFWNVFRDGLCHVGSFFEQSRTAAKKGWVLPKIALDGSFSGVPTFDKDQNGEEIIKLNPWLFADFVIQKYRDDPSLIHSIDAPLLPLHYEVTRPNPE